VLPRRLGVRFALEAIFLVLLAVGAGLADLRPLFIIAVMTGGWALVALAELAAHRAERSPFTYLLPSPAPASEAEEEEPREVFGLRPEERTVVAPPEPAAEPPASEAAPVVEQIPAPEPLPEPEPQPEPVPEPEPELAPVAAEPEPEPQPDEMTAEPRRRRRRLFGRREPEPEPPLPSPPRHVKLLPRRTDPEPSRAEQEVAELFDTPSNEDTMEETRT
jgi:hypothetical protein